MAIAGMFASPLALAQQETGAAGTAVASAGSSSGGHARHPDRGLAGSVSVQDL